MAPIQRRAKTAEPRKPSEARGYAMDALARREHGRGELAQKMNDAGFESDVVTDTLDKLAAEGLQCDARFVESFIASYARRGKGPVRIQHELCARGVDDALSAQALSDSGIDWYQAARDVRCRKFGRETPEAFPERARQMRFLQYRGFTGEQIAASFSRSER